MSLMFCSKSPSVSIRFTICHEHACAACPTHVCYCIWRKRVYVIANEGFGLGTGQALLRSPRGRNASRDGLVKLGWVHCLQYTLNCFQYNVCGLCRCEPSNQLKILWNANSKKFKASFICTISLQLYLKRIKSFYWKLKILCRNRHKPGFF